MLGTAPVGSAEQIGGVVLDLEQLAAVQRLASDQRIFAFIKTEPEEVRGRNELGLAGLPEQAFHIFRGRHRCGVAARAPTFAALLPREKIRLVPASVSLSDGNAVHLERTSDEEPVLDEPGVLAALAPERRLSRTADVDGLTLLEHVLLQLLPVLVARGQDLPHERIEVGLHGT